MTTNIDDNWNLAILTAVILLLLFFWFYKFLLIKDTTTNPLNIGYLTSDELITN